MVKFIRLVPLQKAHSQGCSVAQLITVEFNAKKVLKWLDICHLNSATSFRARFKLLLMVCSSNSLLRNTPHVVNLTEFKTKCEFSFGLKESH